MSAPISVFSYASGLAGPDPRCADGPSVIQNSPSLAKYSNLELDWRDGISPAPTCVRKIDQVVHMCQRIARFTHNMTEQQQAFLVLGGDHSSAIGTWSGVQSALPADAHLGLLWIDAHLDSHTPETSLTGNIHGMPLATLLGYGAKELVALVGQAPTLSPAYVQILGVRSYEVEEMDLLSRLGVRIYNMDEIHQRTFAVVLAEAMATLKQRTPYIGITFDIDAIDPHDAPGVCTPAGDGLLKNEVLAALQQIMREHHFIGTEIVEFNPHCDHDHKTEQLIVELMNVLRSQ